MVDIKQGIIGAGAGGGFGLNAPGKGPTVNSFAGGGKVGGNKAFDIDEKCKVEWNKMLDDKDECHFIVGGYSTNGKMLEFKASGEGRLGAFQAALKEHCGEENCGWGGFRCYGIDDRGNTVSKRAKHVFVQYMPSSAPSMRKAKMGSHKGLAKSIFDKAHVDVCVEDAMEDLDKEELVKKLQGATGAHKPNGYEFEIGEFVDADYYGRGVGKSAK